VRSLLGAYTSVLQDCPMSQQRSKLKYVRSYLPALSVWTCVRLAGTTGVVLIFEPAADELSSQSHKHVENQMCAWAWWQEG
jgi:hypothetical protein